MNIQSDAVRPGQHQVGIAQLFAALPAFGPSSLGGIQRGIIGETARNKKPHSQIESSLVGFAVIFSCHLFFRRSSVKFLVMPIPGMSLRKGVSSISRDQLNGLTTGLNPAWGLSLLVIVRQFGGHRPVDI